MAKRKPKRSWSNVLRNLRGMMWTREGRTQLGLYLGFALILIGALGLADRSLFSADDITPEHARFGWNEDIAKQEAPGIAAEMPKFAITDTDGNPVTGEGKNAELWKFVRLANDGKHIPTWRQESGDCVSMGWSNAIAYRMGYQIAREQRNEILKIPFAPYAYGVSRVLIGKRSLGRGAGSIGAWAAKGSQAYGVLPSDEAARLGFRYSGRLADQWGWSGPPKSTIDYASKFRIRTVSQVKTWEDTRDALVHGYPITVASNVGFTGGSYDRDGKRWLRARGTWGHQMCFVGVEDRPGREKGAYCLNSWGVDAHPKPINDEPPGGFWVDYQTVQRMVGQGDSWAYSDFDGFPASSDGADWNAFKLDIESVADGQDAELLSRAETPEPQPYALGWRKMIPLYVCAIVLVLGCVVFFPCLYEKLGLPKMSNKSGVIGALLIAAAFLSAGDRVFAGRKHRLQMMQQRYTAPSPPKAVATPPIPLIQVCHASWCQYCPQQVAMLRAAKSAGLIADLELIDTEKDGTPWWCDAGLPATGWKDASGKQWRIPGACTIEHVVSEWQRTDALAKAEQASRPAIAEATVETFSAFEMALFESKPPDANAWTSWPVDATLSQAKVRTQ